MSADALQTAGHFIYVTQVHFCAMYAVVIWDWIISIPREIKFIWRTPNTPVKIAYLFCRYWVICVVPYLLFCFVLDHPQSYCERIYSIPVALAMWNQFGSEVILLIRTYAFFSQSKKVLAFLVATLSGMVAYQLYVAIFQMDLLIVPFLLTANDKGIEPTGPCLPVSKNHSAHLLGFFIAPLLFDSIVTFMTVGKAIKIRRCNGGPSSQLIQTFLREGVFFYLLISIANLVNGIFYLQPRQELSALCIPLCVMLGPLLACRLILDLRQRGSADQESASIPAFTTKSVVDGSPFSMRHRKKGSMLARNTMNSNVMLSTCGSVGGGNSKDLDDSDDLEMDIGVGNHRRRRDLFALGVNNGRHSEDMDLENDAADFEFRSTSSPTPEYADMGFKAAPPPEDETQISGIRVDIEKTST